MMFSLGSRQMQRPDPVNGAGPAFGASAGARTVQAGSPAAADVQLALREPSARPIRALLGEYAIELAVQLGIGAALGLMGPFGTFDALRPLVRFAYWMLAVPLVGLPATLVFRALFASAALAAWPWPAKLLAAALITAIPGALIVRALESQFGIPALEGAAGLAVTFGAVVLVTLGIGLWVIAATQRHAVWPSPTPIAEPPPQSVPCRPGASPFLARIPPRLGTNLLRIETEDHYLRVHTDRGSDLVLFRLADALAEIDSGLGLQVHRSHWIARHAVAGVDRDGHRTTLLLTDGARVPVSRTFLPMLRKAGWL